MSRLERLFFYLQSRLFRMDMTCMIDLIGARLSHRNATEVNEMRRTLETYTFGGGVNFYDNDNHSGFSWCYMESWSEDMRWWCGPREFQIQASFAGQITQPVRAVMDDFGTLVAIH